MPFGTARRDGIVRVAVAARHLRRPGPRQAMLDAGRPLPARSQLGDRIVRLAFGDRPSSTAVRAATTSSLAAFSERPRPVR